MTEYAPGIMDETWRRIALTFTIIFALAAPWSIAIAQSSVIGLAIVLVLGLALRRVPAWPIPWTLVLVLAFLAFQAISIPLGEHPARSLRCFRGSWVLLFPFVFWQVLADASIRRRSLAALGVSGGLAGLYGIVQHFQGIDWLHGGRVLENYGGGGYLSVGNLSSHLTYAGVLLPIFFLALGSALSNKGRTRTFWVLSFVFMGLALVFSFTRSAWVGFAAGLLLFGLLLGKRPAALVLGALVVIVLVASAVEPALARRLASILEVRDSERWRLWESSLRIVSDHPWTGAGLGSFKTLFPIYKVPGSYLSTIHPHNDFLNHLVETGVLGAAAWLGIWVAFFAETRRRGDRRAIALSAAMGAMLVAGLAQCYSTDEEVAQVWWFLAMAGLHEAGRDTRGNRAPFRQLSRSFKARTLPLLARILVPRVPAAGSRNDPERSPLVLAGATRSTGSESLRILVVRPDQRLGNLLLLTPFLAALRQRFPTAHIGMIAGDEYAPLLEDWPWVDAWFIQPKRAHARAPWRFVSWARGLRRERWDVAFEMSNHNTHSYYSCLLTLLSGAPTRIGFSEPRNRDVLTHPVPVPHPDLPFALAPLALLSPLGAEGNDEPGEVPARSSALACPVRRSPTPEFTAWRQELPAAYAIVHLGGRGGKAWPLAAWAALLPELRERLPIVLVAGPDEVHRLRGVEDLPGMYVAPRLSLVDLTHFLRGARVYLGCDSGVMHLAAAVDTPVVSLFFRSNPYHYAPLGERHALVLLANPYDVDATRWNEPLLHLSAGDPSWNRHLTGTVRARLFSAESTSDASRLGLPSTGDDANRAILAGLDHALSGSSATNDRQREA